MNYEIQKNVPIANRYASKAAIWPILKMEVGDSFLVPIKEYSPSRVHAILATTRIRNLGWAWTARMIKSEGGIRIWCIQKPDDKISPIKASK